MSESRVDRLRRQQIRVYRWLYAGMFLGPFIAYAIYIPLKLWDAAPAHATWPYVFIVPIIGFAGLAGLMSLAMRRDMQRAAKEDAAEAGENL